MGKDVIELPVRFIPVQAHECEVRDEKDLVQKELRWRLPVEATALVMVDCWDRHYLTSHQERSAKICRERIRPVLDSCRSAGITIVHAPNFWVARHYSQQLTRYADETDLNLAPASPSAKPFWPPQAFLKREGAYAEFGKPAGTVLDIWKEMQPKRRIVAEIAPERDDYVVATGAQLHRLCAHKGILHHIYAGFATNMCLLHYRDYGVMAMAGRGYNIILLRDCTTALEAGDTLAEESMTRHAVLQIEMMFGTSTTSKDLVEACAV